MDGWQGWRKNTIAGVEEPRSPFSAQGASSMRNFRSKQGSNEKSIKNGHYFIVGKFPLYQSEQVPKCGPLDQDGVI